MRHRKPARRKGFTILEVLITIAVVSIAFLGTMAALAFGITASRDTSQHTVALNYNRRMLELIYQGGFIANPPGAGDPIPLAAPAAVDTSNTDPNWKQLYYLPTRPDGLVQPFVCPVGTNWFSLNDWYPPRPNGVQYNYPECQRFQLEEPKYQVNLTVQNDQLVDVPTGPLDPKNNILRLVVQTRWREKLGTKSGTSNMRWRLVRTDAVVVP